MRHFAKLAAVCVAVMAIVAICPAVVAGDCPNGICTVQSQPTPGVVIDAYRVPSHPLLLHPVPIHPAVCHPPHHQLHRNHFHHQAARYRGSQSWTVGFTVRRQCGPHSFQRHWY